MSKQFKPMLAGKAPDTSEIRFPIMVSAKLDGVRCIVINGVAMSRSLKPIPNKYVQSVLSHGFNNLDGELIIGETTDKDVYRNTVSGVMREDGEPNFTFWVFDTIDNNQSYLNRWNSLKEFHKKGPVRVLKHILLYNAEDLLQYEQYQLACGCEGVIIRDPNGPYKCGRSSTKEGYLLKLKRFNDAEAIIIEIQELLKNENEATTNELGRTARSSHKENLIPMGTLGAIIAKDVTSGIEFGIGTGYTADLRQQLWNDRNNLIGKIVKYKYFDGGIKVAPRFPVFLGLRDPIDM